MAHIMTEDEKSKLLSAMLTLGVDKLYNIIIDDTDTYISTLSEAAHKAVCNAIMNKFNNDLDNKKVTLLS